MAKFMILYRSAMGASDRMENSTPEDMQASMGEWMKWSENLSDGVTLEWGLPLQFRHHFGAEAAESDVSGYSILEAESKDAVHKAIEAHPHLKEEGASIDALELLPMPGM